MWAPRNRELSQGEQRSIHFNLSQNRPLQHQIRSSCIMTCLPTNELSRHGPHSKDVGFPITGTSVVFFVPFDKSAVEQADQTADHAGQLQHHSVGQCVPPCSSTEFQSLVKSHAQAWEQEDAEHSGLLPRPINSRSPWFWGDAAGAAMLTSSWVLVSHKQRQDTEPNKKCLMIMSTGNIQCGGLNT